MSMGEASKNAESGAPRGLTGGSKAVMARACGLSHVKCREGWRAASTRLRRRQREIPGRTGHRPSSRNPPRQTSLQHEVLSSTVIRRCSRELLPGTLCMYRAITTRGLGTACITTDVHSHTHTHTQALPHLPLLGGSQGARPKRSKTLSPPELSIEGTLLITVILLVRFSPVGFL